MHSAKFKFYAELNYFLKKEHKNVTFTYHFSGNPAIKDSIEAIGVPLGYFVRHVTIIAQVKEIITRFNLSNKIKPFTRCLECNGKISPVAKAKIINALPADTKRYYKKFYQCSNCGKIYWQGSHYKNMLKNISRAIIHQYN
jgi:uncharacterized protein with PIN domain